MKRLFLTAVLLAAASGAGAQAPDDCIENIRGETVCGDRAEAVRARIRAEAAYAQNPRKAERARSASPYGRFSSAAFVRGGYAFAGLNPGENFPTDAPLASAGFRFPVSRSGSSLLSFESEAVVLWGDETIFDPFTGVTAEISGTSVVGLFGLRWQHQNPAGGLSPFVSAGAGPAYLRSRVEFDDGSPDLAGDTLAFGYGARAGVAVSLAERVSIEWAYRYLGATRDTTVGAHAAELGLNLKF